jgi:hypothetical protein
LHGILKRSSILPLERAMDKQEPRQPNFPTVEFAIDAIADWVNRYRSHAGEDLGQCDAEEVRLIAKDLGISASELRSIASKGPGGADPLRRLLGVLEIDPARIAQLQPGVLRDLQKVCAGCADKKRCVHELSDGTAAEHFHEFCPNAYTLDALLAEKLAAEKH